MFQQHFLVSGAASAQCPNNYRVKHFNLKILPFIFVFASFFPLLLNIVRSDSFGKQHSYRALFDKNRRLRIRRGFSLLKLSDFEN